jgi:hypothetical protein
LVSNLLLALERLVCSRLQASLACWVKQALQGLALH